MSISSQAAMPVAPGDLDRVVCQRRPVAGFGHGAGAVKGCVEQFVSVEEDVVGGLAEASSAPPRARSGDLGHGDGLKLSWM